MFPKSKLAIEREKLERVLGVDENADLVHYVERIIKHRNVWKDMATRLAGALMEIEYGYKKQSTALRCRSCDQLSGERHLKSCRTHEELKCFDELNIVL